ncbi:MAG TPA: FCD domain-containing protein [Pseudorhodoferax sp.]|nr:FCD domain-containing protein [Pseudorhodoferax sp.]
MSAPVKFRLDRTCLTTPQVLAHLRAATVDLQLVPGTVLVRALAGHAPPDLGRRLQQQIGLQATLAEARRYGELVAADRAFLQLLCAAAGMDRLQTSSTVSPAMWTGCAIRTCRRPARPRPSCATSARSLRARAPRRRTRCASTCRAPCRPWTAILRQWPDHVVDEG